MKNNAINILKRTERGWGGHFICSHYCLFRRNTLLEYRDKKWIVSTIGNYHPDRYGEMDTVGHERWYETMAFEAKENDPYLDADVTKQLRIDSDWGLCASTTDELFEKYQFPDNAANEMHERIVKEFEEKIQNGWCEYE